MMDEQEYGNVQILQEDVPRFAPKRAHTHAFRSMLVMHKATVVQSLLYQPTPWARWPMAENMLCTALDADPMIEQGV